MSEKPDHDIVSDVLRSLRLRACIFKQGSYCGAWALVHGAVALYHSPFWSNVVEDQEGFFQFLMDIGVPMGNKRKRDA